MKSVRLSALRTSCLYPQEISLVLIVVIGCVDPRAMVRPEGLCQRKMKFRKGWLIVIIYEHYIKLFGQYFISTVRKGTIHTLPRAPFTHYQR